MYDCCTGFSCFFFSTCRLFPVLNDSSAFCKLVGSTKELFVVIDKRAVCSDRQVAIFQAGRNSSKRFSSGFFFLIYYVLTSTIFKMQLNTQIRVLSLTGK